ncbi:MAG: endonuclease/exonuclease/phosphatase family protein [Planctomycetota bacterium]
MRTKILAVWLLIAVGCDRTAENAISDQPGPPNPPAPVRISSYRVLAWNVESGGSDAQVITSQLKQMSGYDLYALSEVSPRDLETYAAAFEGYDSVTGRTGRADRLQILFDADRFRLIGSEELEEEGGFKLNNGHHRSPLVVQLMELETKIAFQLTVNHLARGSAELREEQASGLREWARQSSMPTIAIGDFNFDYSFISRSGNPAFAAMMRDNVWQWVQPEEWIDTNWADGGRGRTGDGIDDYPDSMLDFAFVAGPARDWSPVFRVIKRPGDFPDDETTSDHRPIELILTP